MAYLAKGSIFALLPIDTSRWTYKHVGLFSEGEYI